jgi:hypothetical protein
MTMTQEEPEKKARAAMPETAALVDELRAALGREFVDGAIAAGQRARREYQRRVATVGQEAADAWLASQQFPAGAFFAEEAGHQVGVRLIHDGGAAC